jgi:hypothetical protein
MADAIRCKLGVRLVAHRRPAKRARARAERTRGRPSARSAASEKG